MDKEIVKRINAEIQKLDNKITDHHRAMSAHAKAFVSAVSTYTAAEIAKGAGKNLYAPVQQEHEYILAAKEKKALLESILYGSTDCDESDVDENHIKHISIMRSCDIVGTIYKCRENLLESPELALDCIKEMSAVLDRLKSGAKCPKCGKELYLSDLPQYAHVCYHCDENFYDFEVKRGEEEQGNG